jgi:tetratricopeptide (TPR) repeat protein
MAVIRLNLGMALAAAGRLEESFEAAREALRLEPRNLVCLYETARALNRLGRHGQALELLGPAVRAAPREPMFQLEYGVALAGAGRLDEAEERYRSAVALKPDLLPAYLALGILYESSNRAADLAAIVEQALAAGVPEPELAYLSALSLKRQGRFEEALALAEQAPATTDPADKAQLIGEICDRLGDTQRAFAAFSEMNRLDAAHPSDPRAAAAAYRRSVEAVAALTTRQWFGAWAPAEPKLEPAAPVFLVGFPRSGTTLLDTMLMAHPGLHVLEELPVLQRVNERLGPLERLAGLSAGEIESLRGLYFDEVDALAPGRGQKMVVDKFPLAIGLAPLIHRIFPDARFIFAERHPCDVVLSCFMTRFGINEGVANFLDLGDAAALYDLMLDYWHRAEQVFPLKVHRFRYENMIADRRSELAPLVEFLGLEWDDGLLDHRSAAAERGYVSTPSYAQVTEKLYTRASGRWQRYRRELEPVMPILRPWVERLGYNGDGG